MRRSTIDYNTWYNCLVPDANKTNYVELCKVRRLSDGNYHVVTYYDGKDLFSSDRVLDCLKWIENHLTNRRYYN